MTTHCHIRGNVLGRRDGFHAQWTDGHLDILSQARGAIVTQVGVVVQAEGRRTGVTTHWEEVCGQEDDN